MSGLPSLKIAKRWIILSAVVFFGLPSLAGAQTRVRPEFEPGWQPPPGAGERSAATARILTELRSQFEWAGTTIQIVTSGDANFTLRYTTSVGNGWGRRRGRTGWVNGGRFRSRTACNNSTANARGQGATGAHEAGHGLNATHNESGVMRTRSSAGAKANTQRTFSSANRSRMLSAARVNMAAAGPARREGLVMVFSHGPLLPPGEEPEDDFDFNATVSLTDPEWDFGFINDVGNFVPSADPFAGGESMSLDAGEAYDFAIRNKDDLTMVLSASLNGQSFLMGPFVDPSDAVVPVLKEPYSLSAQVVFFTQDGREVVATLQSYGSNGFAKVEDVVVVEPIPTEDTASMATLFLGICCYGMTRFRRRRDD